MIAQLHMNPMITTMSLKRYEKAGEGVGRRCQMYIKRQKIQV
eukprot:UN06313